VSLDLNRYRLPKPVVVRELGYEALLDARRESFAEFWAGLRAANPELPAIDTLNLDSDPGAALLQAAAFGDLLFVAELNDTARAVRIVDFAEGSDLDLHGAEFADPDFQRHDGETDAAWRERIKTRRRGSSAAGPDDWFSWHALTASPRVAEVSIAEQGGMVRVAVRSFDNGGVPDQELLDAVAAILTSRAVRPRCMQVEVIAAVPVVVPVTARVTLHPDTLIDVFETARAGFVAAFAAEARLGRDVTRDWIKAQLMPAGVYAVDLVSPAADVVIAPHQVAQLGAIDITMTGRKW
jgi:phage-related baseplate assembly protein